LSELLVKRSAPDYLRSDNGSEFTAQPVRGWLQRFGVETLFVDPDSPWDIIHQHHRHGLLSTSFSASR
jgi:transposase InsO family protein